MARVYVGAMLLRQALAQELAQTPTVVTVSVGVCTTTPRTTTIFATTSISSSPPSYGSTDLGGSSEALLPTSDETPYNPQLPSSSPIFIDPIVSTPSASPTTLPSAGGYLTTLANGAVYEVYTESSISGIRLPSVYSRRRNKRQEFVPVSLQDCILVCEAEPACMAVSADIGICELYSSVSERFYSPGNAVAFSQVRFTGYVEEGDQGATSTAASLSDATPPVYTPPPVYTSPASNSAPNPAQASPSPSQAPPISQSAPPAQTFASVPLESYEVPSPVQSTPVSSLSIYVPPNLSTPLVEVSSPLPWSSVAPAVSGPDVPQYSTPGVYTTPQATPSVQPPYETPTPSSSTVGVPIVSSATLSSSLINSPTYTQTPPMSSRDVPPVPTSYVAPDVSTPSIVTSSAPPSSLILAPSQSYVVPSEEPAPAPGPESTGEEEAEDPVETDEVEPDEPEPTPEPTPELEPTPTPQPYTSTPAPMTPSSLTSSPTSTTLYSSTSTSLPPNDGPPKISSYFSSLENRPTSTTATSTTTSTTTTTTRSSSTTMNAPYVPPAPTTTTTTTSSSTSSAPPVASYGPYNNKKRGLCYANSSLTLPYDFTSPNAQVSWGWNYYIERITDSAPNPNMRFIPILFNDAPDLLASWPAAAQKAIDEGADSLLAFNEPDLCFDGAACMTVQQSVRAYRSAMQPFAGKARLGAPAVTNGGPEMSLNWLDQFIGNCTGCTIDFIPLHWYSNVYAFSYLQYYVDLAYQRFGKPIWITEFGIEFNSGATEEQYQEFLKKSMSWLDAVPYVERYSYFWNGPRFLIKEDNSGLSAQGVIYNTYTAPCPNWNNMLGDC